MRTTTYVTNKHIKVKSYETDLIKKRKKQNTIVDNLLNINYSNLLYIREFWCNFDFST